MRQIIKEISRETALEGYVLTLKNQEKLFICDGELNGNKPLVGSVIRSITDRTSKGKHLKYCILDDQRLIKAPKYPFRNYEEALIYADLPLMLRRLAALIKVRNADSQIFPAPEIVYIFEAALHMLQRDGKKQDGLSADILKIFPETCGKEELRSLLVGLSVRISEDKENGNIDKEEFSDSSVFKYLRERFPEICIE